MNRSAVDKVLLVDDDRVTNMMHSRMIRKAELAADIDVVTDGMAALEYLGALEATRQEPPQIVLLDLNMPRMNGFEFLDGYRALPSIVKENQEIVMLSTSILHEDHKRADADPDLQRFVVKPLRPDILQDIFDSYHSRQTA